MVLGRVLHEVIASAHEEQMVSGSLPPVEKLLVYFDGTWGKLAENVEMRYPENGPPREGYSGLGREMLRAFREAAGRYEPPLAVELPFEMELEIQVGGEPRTVFLRGVIDRLDETVGADGEPALVVVDYKSGRKKLNIADVQGEIQLVIYALAVQETLGLPVAQVELFSLRDGEAAAVAPSQVHRDWLVQQVLPYAQLTLERREFAASRGYWCRWCDFQRQCAAEGPGPWNGPDKGGETDGPAA
jgi:CRISPR/Cas system-associated exonuclease Cas4 (RecB family)